MTPRRKTPKSRGTTEPKNGDFATGVLVEELRGHMKAVLERLQDCTTKGELAEFREEFATKTQLLDDKIEAKALQLEHKIDARARQLEDKFEANTDRLEAKLETSTERLHVRIELVEDGLRLAKRQLAARLDTVDQRFDGVDQQLREIRQDVSLQAQGTELRALEQRVTVLERAQSSSSRT